MKRVIMGSLGFLLAAGCSGGTPRALERFGPPTPSKVLIRAQPEKFEHRYILGNVLWVRNRFGRSVVLEDATVKGLPAGWTAQIRILPITPGSRVFQSYCGWLPARWNVAAVKGFTLEPGARAAFVVDLVDPTNAPGAFRSIDVSFRAGSERSNQVLYAPASVEAVLDVDVHRCNLDAASIPRSPTPAPTGTPIENK